MSVLAVLVRSLFDPPVPIPVRDETPYRTGRTMRIWRELPPPRGESEQAMNVERIDEDCERWDGFS